MDSGGGVKITELKAYVIEHYLSKLDNYLNMTYE